MVKRLHLLSLKALRANTGTNFQMTEARGLWLCCAGWPSLGGKKGSHPFLGICLPAPCSESQSRGRKPGEGPWCRCRGGCANRLSIHRPLAQGPLQLSRTPRQRPLGAATISEIYFGICSKVGQSRISVRRLRQALVEICYFQKEEADFAHLRKKRGSKAITRPLLRSG